MSHRTLELPLQLGKLSHREKRWCHLVHLLRWVEEAALRFWQAELWLGGSCSGSYSWKPEAWRHHCHTSFTSSTWLADTASLGGLSESLVPSRTSYHSFYTDPFGSKIKTPQESQNKTVFPKLCSAGWSSCPDTAVLLTDVFLKAEQGLLLLPKISLGFFTELSVLNQIANTPPM